MKYIVLGAFCAGLLACIFLDIPILCALISGLILFMLYGRREGFTRRELIRTALDGIRPVRNILITFFLIGIMTALWRAAGTIPFIVACAAELIRPSVFLLMTFLLNSGLSVLTGTAFGTAATMGVICASMGAAMNVSPVLTGGAVLSGVYFGDRCSPVSTSALLTAALTETDIYGNIRRMIRSALIPFVLTCLLYLAAGLLFPGGGTIPDLKDVYARVCRLDPVTILPAVIILLLAALRVEVKTAMSASILTAVLICLTVQQIPLSEILRMTVTGFAPEDAQAAAMLGGGGMISMLKAACIVCISSSYAGILDKTDLLDGARHALSFAARRTGAYASTLLSSAVCGMIACNQTLTIMLTERLCRDLYADRGQLAVDLEDTAVIVAPLVPWSIAGAVPLAAAGAPAAATAASFYLILLPLCRLIASAAGKATGPIFSRKDML